MGADGAEERGCTCVCTGGGGEGGLVGYGATGMGMKCEPCLQFLRQCPPKKRFRELCKLRPIIVKPARSGAVALDRLVEVALSPTKLGPALSCDSREALAQVGCARPDAKSRPRFGGSELGTCGSDDRAAGAIDVYDKGTCSRGNEIHRQTAEPSSDQAKLGSRFKNPFHSIETAQKLKKLSSLNEVVQERRRRSPPVNVTDHSRRFTPRIKSLVDITC
uniref:Uncharacterized protein n=1 Tax=Physcomitrium patens TaxID=3218 RepID=A0A2K1K6W6_PHYPA|nr:hypothetical protein PHYPA_011403 [Physcomitrium patens]